MLPRVLVPTSPEPQTNGCDAVLPPKLVPKAPLARRLDCRTRFLTEPCPTEFAPVRLRAAQTKWLENDPRLKRCNRVIYLGAPSVCSRRC